MPEQFAYRTHYTWEKMSDHTLVLDCSDPRLSQARHEFLTEYCKVPLHDSLIVPGGPVTATHASALCFVEHERIKMLHSLHQFVRVIAIAHHNCGYYANKYPGTNAEQLREYQIYDLHTFRQNAKILVPGAEIELYYVGPNDQNLVEYTRIT